MKSPMILTVAPLLSLLCGVAHALPATPPHHLEPNAPRSVTVSEAQTPPVIRAGLLQSTLILLPAEEKIATVFGGDTVDWVFDAGHVASRFISVKPKLANATTDIHIVSDHGNENTRVLVGFRNAYVFDVEQTEGAELPTLREMTGTVGENRARLVSFIEAQGIELAFTEKIAPALGMSYGGKIAILPGQSEAEEFSTLVHELAHEMLHKAERRTTTTKVVRETEAEAIAFVIGKAVGLETGSASADYIQLYHGNASLLAESLEVIQQTSGVILAALQPPTAEQAAMPDAELAKVA